MIIYSSDCSTLAYSTTELISLKREIVKVSKYLNMFFGAFCPLFEWLMLNPLIGLSQQPFEPIMRNYGSFHRLSLRVKYKEQSWTCFMSSCLHTSQMFCRVIANQKKKWSFQPRMCDKNDPNQGNICVLIQSIAAEMDSFTAVNLL